MKIFSPDNKFSQIIGTLIDLVILSILWVVISLTVVGIGPASTALYYAVAKSIRRERGSTIKEFFRGIKESWKNSILVGLFLVLLAVGIYMLDGYALLGALVNGTVEEPLRFVLGLLELFFFLAIAVYAFPLTSRFEMRSWSIIITAISLVFRYFGRTLLMVAMLIAVVLFLIGLWEFLVLVPGLFVFFLSFPMEKVLGSYLRLSGFEPPENEDTWYLE